MTKVIPGVFRAWMCAVFVCALLVWAESAAVAAKDSQKQPWFALGSAASEARRSLKTRGLAIEIEWLPSLGFDAGLLQPFVSLQWSSGLLTALGHVDMSWHNEWLHPGSVSPSGSVPLLRLADRGSVVRIKYRWRSATRPESWHRELQLYWYPGSHRPVQMGSVLESNWSVFQSNQQRGVTVGGRLGVAFAWDLVSFEGVVLLGRFLGNVGSSLAVETHVPGLLLKFHARPLSWLWLGLDGGFSQGGPYPYQGADIQPYRGWGVHPMARVHWGVLPSAIVFLHRRRLDPRSQRVALSPRRKGAGLSLFAELGIRGHLLNSSADPSQQMLEAGYTLSVRARGQWRLFLAELQFHWQSFDWMHFDGPGFFSFTTRDASSVVTGLYQLSGSLAFQPHPKVTVGARVDLRLPALFQGNLPTSIIGNNPSQKGFDLQMGFHSRTSLIRLDRDSILFWDVRTTLNVRWEPWSFVSLMVESWLFFNPNSSRFVSEFGGSGKIVLEDRVEFFTELLVQVRFR